MLASWMRMKFPSLVQASVVSGDPVLYFRNSTVPEPIFYHYISKIYESLGGKCSGLITEAFDQLALMKKHEKTWSQIETKFPSTCYKADKTGAFLDDIYQDTQHEISYLASRNYPHDSF